jgi:hypothetical protein
MIIRFCLLKLVLAKATTVGGVFASELENGTEVTGNIFQYN